MSEHLLLTASNDGARWVLLMRDYTGRWDVYSTAAGSLEARVAFLIETMQGRPSADLTFSTRRLEEVQAAGLVEEAAEARAAAPGCSLYILAPAGPAFDPNLWATAWRDPRGHLSAGHRDTRFRRPVLLEIIREWFTRENYQSFRPELPRERVNQFQRISHPGWPRELLVRQDWTIADVVAESASATSAAASA